THGGEERGAVGRGHGRREGRHEVLEFGDPAPPPDPEEGVPEERLACHLAGQTPECGHLPGPEHDRLLPDAADGELAELRGRAEVPHHRRSAYARLEGSTRERP